MLKDSMSQTPPVKLSEAPQADQELGVGADRGVATLKLWRISQTENNGYDTFSSAVVAAATEEAARTIHPGEDGEVFGEFRDEPEAEPVVCWISGGRFPYRDDTWSRTLEGVKVELIGDAAPGIEPGVICASFNAG